MAIFRFSFLDCKYPFWMNLVRKFNIFSLCWNLVPRPFWICEIRLWWSLFCSGPFFASSVQKIHFVLWCYLINLAAVYSQRLEVSGLKLILNITWLSMYVYYYEKFNDDQNLYLIQFILTRRYIFHKKGRNWNY